MAASAAPTLGFLAPPIPHLGHLAAPLFTLVLLPSWGVVDLDPLGAPTIDPKGLLEVMSDDELIPKQWIAYLPTIEKLQRTSRGRSTR